MKVASNFGYLKVRRMHTFKLNEERLDYEIHVLRKHEEEVVLVKSDQKRKITGLQDVINRLRQRVAECHRNIEKDEGALQAQNADIRRDPKTYAVVEEVA